VKETRWREREIGFKRKHGEAGVNRRGESGGSGARVSSGLRQALSTRVGGDDRRFLYAIQRWTSPALCSLLFSAC